ncbi:MULTISPECIES: hypothetical protein [Deefgea]|uniref:Uncharacterized protein n=1 Tax=Deefgea chitinilytica TaxID=570276 RepID=A0ABS2CD59_9NEIS|nr:MULTISPECIES: hypothetical protein [Deefgea]MBM5572087.1 hypothetical protein [Deefgea chitinilytica]MBM9889322.1 hypothetical protein [Deefgea sp. CFH1-16]
MNVSPFFTELMSVYDAELEDLMSDSEGRPALKKRLAEKRQQFSHLLPMIEFSPEMVAVVFYNAFEFNSPAMMKAIVASEPDEDDFIPWDQLQENLSIADWAQELVETATDAEGGDVFLVLSAALEYLRLKGAHHSAAAPVTEENDDRDMYDSDDDGGDMNDLDSAGSSWLEEQGFETRDSDN